MTNVITIRNLSKQYQIGQKKQLGSIQEAFKNWSKGLFGGRQSKNEFIWAIKDVSLDIKEGEVVGIIGRNGAGKSTLLKVLSKITYPTSGTVDVRGRVASLLEVGTGFHEELTGRENVFLNGSILGMKRKEVESKLDDIIAFAGVEKFMDTPIKRYSSGMRLRLGFAVAAHLDPDVLIIDEVLAVGDLGFQKKCLGQMEKLRTGGRTVLFVSHNLAAVENLCTRTIWIDDGRIRADGETKKILKSFMASFTGSQQTDTGLNTAETRHGTGEIRYTGIEFLSSDRQPQPLVRSGDGLVVRLHYEAKKSVPYPSFGFKLFTQMGTMVYDVSTWHHRIAIPRVPQGKGCIELELDHVNLLAARYYLSLWITAMDDGKSTIYDGLEQGATLEVEPSDVYQTGRALDSRSGIVYFPGRWKLGGLVDDNQNELGDLTATRTI